MSILLPALLTAVAHADSYEITPLAGWRSSTSLEEASSHQTLKLDKTNSFGIILSMKEGHESTYDFLFTRQNTTTHATSELDNKTSIRFDYYHIGGTNYYPQQSLHPYVTGGIGVTHISSPSNDFNSETKLSISIGGGIKIPLTQNIGLRFEGRGYGTFVKTDGSILCTGNGCIARFRSDLYTQFEALAGVSIAF